MSFKFSAAHSSRIKKPTKPPSLTRSLSTPFSTLQRRKPVQRSLTSKPTLSSDEDDDPDLLPDAGLTASLATDLTLRDVAQAILYIKARTFSPVPPSRSGISSTRTAEILNFRASLPPIVTVAHVQALLHSPTAVEREIAELSCGGAIRKITVGGRGGMGEVLILVRDFDALVEKSNLEADVKKRFIELLHANPTALTLAKGAFEEGDVKALMHAGFLTAATPSWTRAEAFSGLGEAERGTATSLGSIARAASGSMAAVGGEGAVHAAGGTGGGVMGRNGAGGELCVALPAMGPYLKLVAAARAHLVGLLAKGRRSKELPEGMLKERWEGGVESGERRREAGGFGVLPGRTRKWKVFWGVGFEWVLGECVGAGLVEVFETGSVGRGVRCL